MAIEKPRLIHENNIMMIHDYRILLVLINVNSHMYNSWKYHCLLIKFRQYSVNLELSSTFQSSN